MGARPSSSSHTSVLLKLHLPATPARDPLTTTGRAAFHVTAGVMMPTRRDVAVRTAPLCVAWIANRGDVVACGDPDAIVPRTRCRTLISHFESAYATDSHGYSLLHFVESTFLGAITIGPAIVRHETM